MNCRPKRKAVKGRDNSGWYGYEWRKLRARTLAAFGIPKEQWRYYDLDHEPVYNPEIEPDHRMYNLTPRLHSEHSRKTATEDVKRDEYGNFAGRK